MAPRGLHLTRGQARRRVTLLALQHLGIKMATGGIIDQPVLQSVDRVAGIQHRLVDHGVLGRWNIAGGIFEAYVCQPQRPRVPPEGCGIAGDDAVKLVRIAIGLQKPFSAAT